MSYITGLALRKRSVTVLIVILLFGAGVYSYTTFQRELLPPVDLYSVFISAYVSHSDPETMVREITEPIEDAISGVEGLREVRSTTNESDAFINATFDYGTDMKEAAREVESAVNGASLPSDATTNVTRISTDLSAVIAFTVSGHEGTLTLQRLVSDVIQPRLARIQGVSSVTISGEVEEQVIVSVDADKLRAFGISADQVSNAIAQNNASLPVGVVGRSGAEYPVRAASEFGALEDIRQLTVGFEQSEGAGGAGPQTGKRPIKLSDVAEVEFTTAPALSISRVNGNPGLAIDIQKDPDANTVAVTEAVSAAMQDMRRTGVIPPDVEVLELLNNGPEVQDSLNSLLRDGALGLLFAVLVVFVFLLNFRPSLMRGIALSLRPTAIIAISIPLSLLTGILILSFTDVSLNFMSLAGLAIAIGNVVDDSIVVSESIYRHIHSGTNRFEAAVDGTREVGGAVISSTLTTVVIFIPLAFIPGVVGEFFTPFAISVSIAMLTSTALAVTIIPVLAASLLRRGDFSADAISDDSQTRRDTVFQRIYTPILLWTLRYKFLTIATAFIVAFASLGLLRFIPVTFFPQSTPENLTITIDLPTGASVEQAYQEVLALEETLALFVEQGMVDIYQTTVNIGTGPGRSNEASAEVKLSEDAPDDIEAIVRAALPEVKVDAADAGPGGEQEEVHITGPNFSDIAQVTRRLEQRLAQIEGLADITSNVSEGADEVVISVDRTRAGEYSLSTTGVGRQLNQFISGREVSEINIDGKTVDIVLRGDRADTKDINNLKNLWIDSPVGPVKLGIIADIRIKEAPVSVIRLDSERSATITGTVTAIDTGAVGNLIQQAIDNLEDVPSGVQISTGGISERIREGFNQVYIFMGIGVALIYLVMVASLGALRTPFIILISMPLAIVGALVALLITGRTLSLSAMIGFLLLVGIIVNNAIMMLTYVEQLRGRGYEIYDALVEACRVRVRPVLMTASTTIFALLPLAASSTTGGVIGAELATVVVGGLFSSTVLTLIVVPAMYWVFNVSIPSLGARIVRLVRRNPSAQAASG